MSATCIEVDLYCVPCMCTFNDLHNTLGRHIKTWYEGEYVLLTEEEAQLLAEAHDAKCKYRLTNSGGQSPTKGVNATFKEVSHDRAC